MSRRHRKKPIQPHPAQGARAQKEHILGNLDDYLEQFPEQIERIAEQINVTTIASSPTQEDWYWGVWRQEARKIITGAGSATTGTRKMSFPRPI